MDQLLIDLDQAAAQLSISRRSVQGLIFSGDLRSVKVGRCRRIAVEDLEAYVERLRESSELERGRFSLPRRSATGLTPCA